MILKYKLPKIFFLIGAFLLIDNDVGATQLTGGQKIVVTEANDSLLIADKSKVNDNIFYVDEWIKGWFVRLDKDQDNQISRKEFLDNMDILNINDYHITLFENNEVNPDGELSLKEFKSFVDTTKVFTKDEMIEKASARSITESDSFDVVKLLAGVVVISLLMAAFRLM